MEDSKAKIESSARTLPDAHSETAKDSASSLFGSVTKSSKTVCVTIKDTRASLFGSIAQSVIMEGRKSCLSGKKKMEDLIGMFADALALWKTVTDKLTKGKTLKEALAKDLPRAEFAGCYDAVRELFSTVVRKLDSFSFGGAGEYLQKAFSEELIQVAALGIRHANGLAMETLAKSLDSPDTPADQNALDEHFLTLRTLHEFFFALAKLRCNPVLTDRQLGILQEVCKGTFSALQGKVQNNIKLLRGTPIQAQNLRAVATLIYYMMQTVAVLSIFGEAEEQTATKYQSILERFKTIFALISQSSVFERIFSEQYDFESLWGAKGCQYVLSSFGQKRLSLFLQEHKLSPDEDIAFSLKYLVVYYNYKVLKLISQRLQVSYDEHILNIFSVLIHKNRTLLGSIISHKDRPSAIRVMLLINENVYIIKSYIVNLAYFSDNLDPMQRQGKYDTIKDTTIDCLTLAVKFGFYCRADSAPDVDQLTIFAPKDLVAFIFKALLLCKKVRTKNASAKFCHEMVRHLNMLSTDLASRPIPTEDTACFSTYRLYFLQFLSQWDLDSLKDKYVKYSEEMSRYLADYDEEGIDSPVLKQLRLRSQELALEMYVRLAQVDCEPPIEATIGFIRESFTNERKLYKYFYVMFCLLLQQKLPLHKFKRIMSNDPGMIAEVLGPLKASKETATFLQKEGMGVVFLIYKNATASYVQTKEQRHAYELELNATPISRKSLASTEVNTYVTQNYIQKLDATVSAYETLLRDTEAFICALHHAVPVAEFFLLNPEFDADFYQQVVALPCGRSLVLRLLRILEQHLVAPALGRPELVEKFVAIVTDLFQCLMSAQMKFEEEKPFVLSVVEIVELLISNSGDTSREVREILFHRGILVLFLETCQKPNYDSDVETFLHFLHLTKLVVKGNRLFYESPKNKEQVYAFVLGQFDKFMEKRIIAMPVVASLLQYLVDIALEQDLDLKRPQPALVKEASAIEAYFGILVRCFKSMPEDSNAGLRAHVLTPLEALSNSLMNDSVLAKVGIQELLMKILKRARDHEFRRQVSSHIGRISSTSTSADHIERLLRHFIKSSKYVPRDMNDDYYISLLDTLVDSISGESIRSLYFFPGQERGFIRLRSPLPTLGPGICWTGRIRLERGYKEQRQCIFSLLKVKPNEVKGVELYVQDRKLVYRLVQLKKGDYSVTLTLPNIEIREDAWHHITLAHVDRELTVYVDESFCTIDAATQSFAKHQYNYATVGAATDPNNTKKYHSFFFGEMAAMYFFRPSAKFREAIKDLAHWDQYLASLYKHEGLANDPRVEPGQYKGPKYIDREFVATTHFVLDPKVPSRRENKYSATCSGSRRTRTCWRSKAGRSTCSTRCKTSSSSSIVRPRTYSTTWAGSRPPFPFSPVASSSSRTLSNMSNSGTNKIARECAAQSSDCSTPCV